VYAQQDCTVNLPQADGLGDHKFACFYPVNTDDGRIARAANIENGQTATGLKIQTAGVS
tara:strand:- start:334 stop:510 length:177 start_codon:yes stop_codon:yes gene_type:complete